VHRDLCEHHLHRSLMNLPLGRYFSNLDRGGKRHLASFVDNGRTIHGAIAPKIDRAFVYCDNVTKGRSRN